MQNTQYVHVGGKGHLSNTCSGIAVQFSTIYLNILLGFFNSVMKVSILTPRHDLINKNTGYLYTLVPVILELGLVSYSKSIFCRKSLNMTTVTVVFAGLK